MHSDERMYIVSLSEVERLLLQKNVSSGMASARSLAHARVLLKADEGPDGPGCIDTLIAGTSNVIATLPSGLVGPWLNAADAIGLLRGFADPSGVQPTLPGGGEGVRAGSAVEDRPDFEWMTWEKWRQPLPQLGPAA
jgi:hypothetical protein